MEQIEVYKELQIKLLAMTGKEEIDDIKEFIEKNGLLNGKSKSLATIRLIASVAYSHIKLLRNAIILVNLLGKIEVKKKLTSYINHEEIRNREKTINLLLRANGQKLDEDYISVLLNEYEKMVTSGNPSLLKALLDDNVESLQSYISKNNYDLNQTIPYSYYDQNYPILVSAKAIDYAALFGSINCFKFLMMNMEDLYYQGLLNSSIAGGNHEIIHIVENKIQCQDSIDYNQLLEIAILFMQNDLIDYIIEKSDIKIESENYIKCIYSSNYEAILKLRKLDDSDSINYYGEIGSTPIDIAAFEDYLDFFKFFLSIKGIQYKKLNNYGKTILQSAVRGNSLDIVKYIDRKHLINFNYEGTFGMSPFMIAARFNIVDILKYYKMRSIWKKKRKLRKPRNSNNRFYYRYTKE